MQESEIKSILQNEEWEENEKIIELMNLIGKKRGAVISGGEIDLARVSILILDVF